MEQNNQKFNEFLESHPVFKEGSYSVALRNSFVASLLGLGLPIPGCQKKELWGYEKKDYLYFPVKKDLDAFFTASQMADSLDYYVDDVIKWLNEASQTRVQRRNFFQMRKNRPLFKEYKLPLDTRIDIFNGRIASITKKEKSDTSGKRQTAECQGEKETHQGNGAEEREALH